MNELKKGGPIMTCLSKNISLEIMKFFLNTSVPKILSERKGVTSN